MPFSRLYETVRQGRNDALHQGAYARHLTIHAIQLALVLEDALMNGYTEVKEFMVQDPICAQTWQPMSFVRQTMLTNSFSFLPVRWSDGKWKFVSAKAVGRFLREAGENGRDERKARLAMPLTEAESLGLGFEDAPCLTPTDSVQKALDGVSHLPFLVLDPEHKETPLGILTSFDLL